MHYSFYLLQLHRPFTLIITEVDVYLLRHKMYQFFDSNLRPLFGVLYCKICDFRIKQYALNAKQGNNFWFYVKRCECFYKIYICVKSTLKQWILSHLHFIQSPIADDFIKVRLYGRNVGTMTEVGHKCIWKCRSASFTWTFWRKYASFFVVYN